MATGGFAPEELEFFAEDTIVTIVPNQRHPVFYLLSGDVGPMEPSVPIEVPLWLAVHMRKRKQCRLVPPDWMNVEFLAEALKRETEMEPGKEASELTEVPEHYVALSHIILEHFADELPQSLEIRRLVKDLLDRRLTKLRLAIEAHFRDGKAHGRIVNITQMEMSSVRSMLLRGMDQMDMVKGAGAGALRMGNSGQTRTTLSGLRGSARR